MSAERKSKLRHYTALIPFFIAVPGVILATLLWCLPHGFQSYPVAFAVLFAALVFDLPACVYVLIRWIRNGQPPELSLAPLGPSPVEQGFRQRLRERPRLSDDEFYSAYFADSGIPQHLPVRLRKSMEKLLHCDLAALHPSDDLSHANDDVSPKDIVRRIEKNFGVEMPRAWSNEIDGTFDSLLNSVQRAMDAKATHA